MVSCPFCVRSVLTCVLIGMDNIIQCIFVVCSTLHFRYRVATSALTIVLAFIERFIDGRRGEVRLGARFHRCLCVCRFVTWVILPTLRVISKPLMADARCNHSQNMSLRKTI